MKLKIGDLVTSEEWGEGIVVTFTRQWIIYNVEDTEVAVPIEDCKIVQYYIIDNTDGSGD